MYNLLKANNFNIVNKCSVAKQIIAVPLGRPCSFCSHVTYSSYLVKDIPFHVGKTNIRSSSSSCNSALIFSELKKRRRYARHKKRFTELLEVNSVGHSETVASVKRLKPRDVSLLSENPDISLEYIHNLKVFKTNKSKKNDKLLASNDNEVSNSYFYTKDCKSDEVELNSSKKLIIDQETSCKPICEVNDDNSIKISKDEIVSELHEEMNVLTDVEQLSLLSDFTIKKNLLKEIEEDENRFEVFAKELAHVSSEKEEAKSFDLRNFVLNSTDKEKLAKVKFKDLDVGGKQQNLNSLLLTYLDTCVSCGFLNRGLATLQFYAKRNKYNKKALYPDNIKIFDVLLQGFASKGKYEKFQDVWNLIKNFKIKPSFNSYAAKIECIVRAQSGVESDALQKTIQEMSEQGIMLNDLFENCKFLGDQREVILGVFQKLYPDFEPVLTPPDLCYSCSLLKRLNEEKSKALRSPVEDIFSAKELIELSDQQLKNEIQGVVPIKSIEKRLNPSPTVKIYRDRLNAMKKVWEKAILKALDRDISIMNSAQNHMKSFKFPTLFPYLKVLTAEQFKDIIMQEINKLAEGSETFSPTTFQLYKELGLKVRSRFIIKFKQDNMILDKTQKLYHKYCEWYVDPKNNGFQSSNARKEWQQLVFNNQEGPSVHTDEKVWPTALLIGLGKFLYNIILQDIKIDVNVLKIKSHKHEFLPGFYTIYRQQNNRSVEEIKPHPILARLFRATEPEEIVFDVDLVPMSCPPLPWNTPDSGGYLLFKADFLRLPLQALKQLDCVRKASSTQLYPEYDSLNQLSSIPWKVNKKVLDTMIEVFNRGGSSKLEVPEPPSSYPMPEPITPDMSNSERFQNYRKRLIAKRKKSEMYSLWCDALYRLSLANHFREKVFWLPHNMDFRGRVYPCPPHLNHLGPDLARSLLCFAKGKPLGETGLDWLKIHVVNLTGLKKKNSVIERLAYANEMIDDIIDSAQNPLTGRMWWAESESPWQTLACCIEIWNAIQNPGGPLSFISHFPIHQDGSCNGLQHYAALGRDKDGAASVNLSPALVPQDVYSCVATIVEKERAADAAKGVKVAQQLDGFIQRKVIKQTVMTTVYGVTRFGARLQIAKQLKDIDAFPKDYVWSASHYLVGKTFESLRQMFTSTREIQDWFTECAHLISQVCGENVEYVTPLGLPVVQPYTRRKQISVPNNIHGRIDTSSSQNFVYDMYERPNVMKQKNAFPPNFIHSLDSSHMMLTSLHCEQEGITYVSVHDCFWTHPCTVHIMNKICREQFVALHSEPILENLSAFLMDKFGYPENDFQLDKKQSQVLLSKQRLNSTLKKVPPKGNFQLENVLDSVYFFS